MTMTMYRIQKSRFLPVLALVFPLLVNQASAFAASKLERIEFKPTSTVTDIQLHSESVLPYHIAFSSDNKLMIDLENVTSDGTIDTRFEGISETSTISNVVLQPLNDHSLRIIIRGEHLAPPHVGFTPIQTGAKSTVPSTANATSPLIPESLGEDIPLDGGLSKAVHQPEGAPIIHQAPAKPKISQVGIAQDLNLSSELDVRRPAPADKDAFIAGLLSQITSFSLGTWAPYGVAAILLLGLGIFILKKIQMMASQRQNSFEFLMEKQTQGQAIGFRQLANAYRDEHPENQPELPQQRYQESDAQQFLPADIPQNDKIKGDNPIGLGRLSQLIDSMAQNPPSQMPVSPQHQAQKVTQQRIQQSKTEPAKPVQPPKAPSRQAAQQYAQSDRQNHLAKAKQKPANSSQNLQRRPMDEEQLRQELMRANDAQQETRQRLQSQAGQGLPRANSSQALNRPNIQQRQAMPTKQPKGNEAPLSGNPEVLNFLKNVADLMEKDGRGNMAQTFRSKAKPIE